MNDLNGRIKLVRNTLGLTQEKFSDKIGLSTSNYGQIEIGKSNPTANVLCRITNEFQVNGDWLLTGRGEMFLNVSKDFGQNLSIVEESETEYSKNNIAEILKQNECLKKREKDLMKQLEYAEELINFYRKENTELKKFAKNGKTEEVKKEY